MKEENKLYPYQNLSIEDMEGEVWSTINDYPNYMVSNLGRIKSLNYNKTNQPRILKQSLKKEGYLKVTISNEQGRKTFRINRLVALIFISNPQQLDCVNHRDENKLNNTVENLEWITQADNINYGTHNKRASESRINHPLLSKVIVQLDTNNIGRKWVSATEAHRQLQFDVSHIGRCCKGIEKMHKGYKWSYFYPPSVIN